MRSKQHASDGKDCLETHLIAYKPPRRDVDCRICQQLEGEGDTINIYDNHLHNYPTGCPRYITMSIENRNKIARKAKFCLRCHDPAYINTSATQASHDCLIGLNKKRSRYTYNFKGCFEHLWICIKHKKENNDMLKTFKDEISSRYQLNF